MSINLVLTLFAGMIILLSVFSTVLQRISLPGPLVALGCGVVLGPYALDVLRIEDFGLPASTLLEQAARITLAIGLAGVALRLPHGYWRRSLRWLAVIIGLGMVGMLLVATGVLWAGLQVPMLTALLVAAIITPNDPVVTTPIVTGSQAEVKVSEKVRYNLSAESGLNDGLGYLFVLLPVLLLTRPSGVWGDFAVVVLWEVLGAAVFGAGLGLLLGRLFVVAKLKRWMEQSSYLGFVIPFGLFTLGAAKLLGTDGVLAVFVAAAVFGQVIPQRDEDEEDKVDDAVNRIVLLPVFVLLGMALPFRAWAELGWPALLALIGAVFGRRLLTLWALRPLLRPIHSRAETFFLSCLGADPRPLHSAAELVAAQRHLAGGSAPAGMISSGADDRRRRPRR